MPTFTPRWSLPFLEENQDGPEVTHNEALILIDAVMGARVLDMDLSTPPGSPAQGDAYVVAGSPTGAWSGHAGKLAVYVSGWKFATIPVGAIFYVADSNIFVAKYAAGYETITTT